MNKVANRQLIAANFNNLDILFVIILQLYYRLKMSNRKQNKCI